jgi:hypothetical protein
VHNEQVSAIGSAKVPLGQAEALTHALFKTKSEVLDCKHDVQEVTLVEQVRQGEEHDIH